MGRRVEVPITPALLRWAVDESGLSTEEICRAARVSSDAYLAWLAGTARPSLTQLKRVAKKVRRQLAVFLLPEVPKHAISRRLAAENGQSRTARR